MHQNEVEEPPSEERILKQDQGSNLSVKAPVWERGTGLSFLH